MDEAAARVVPIDRLQGFPVGRDFDDAAAVIARDEKPPPQNRKAICAAPVAAPDLFQFSVGEAQHIGRSIIYEVEGVPDEYWAFRESQAGRSDFDAGLRAALHQGGSE